MARSNGAKIVLRRIEEGSHGHHGGAWKVAYADFVTAMMAFFLRNLSRCFSEGLLDRR